MTSKQPTSAILNYDPSLDDVVTGANFYADVVAWRAETMDTLEKSVNMVNAIWELRGYRTLKQPAPARYCPGCGCELDADGRCPRETELDASIAAEAGDDDTEEIVPRIFPDEVFMPDDYVPADDIDFDTESWW